MVCDPWEKVPLDTFPGSGHLRALTELVQRHRPKIIHAHGIRAGFISRLWVLSKRLPGRRKAGLPHLIYTVHGLHPEYAPASFRRWLGLTAERLLNRAADRVVAVSESERALILERKLAPERKLSLIPNAIDGVPFQAVSPREEVRALLQIPEQAFAVGTLSRLNRQKAVHVLLEAAARLQHEIPHMVILIAGDGPLRADLERRRDQAGLEGIVRFLGEVTDTPLFYRALDVFCLTSLWEGSPLTVLESAAAGIPTVATKVPGTTDLLSHEKTALLVPPNDPAALEQALLRVRRDSVFAWRLAAKANQQLKPLLRSEGMCQAVADLYSQTVEEDTAPTTSRENLK
jgi:glycosyltransferase involved in cell wall biosynthesis